MSLLYWIHRGLGRILLGWVIGVGRHGLFWIREGEKVCSLENWVSRKRIVRVYGDVLLSLITMVVTNSQE